MIGVLRTVHAWAGVVLALLMVVFGLTGTLLVFEDDWVRLTQPAAREGFMPSPQTLGPAMQRIVTDHPDATTVVFGGSTLGVHGVYLPDETFAYADRTGRIVDLWQGRARAEVFVFDLHHDLMAGDVGHTIAGVAGIALALLVLTGMVVWIPAWRATGWRIWPRSGKRRELIGSHRNLGLMFALPILMLALTGAGVVFYKTTQALFTGGNVPPAPAPVVGTGTIDWTRALSAAQTAYPDATLRMAGPSPAPGRPAYIRMKQPGEWHPNGRTTLLIDPATSSIAANSNAQTQSAGVRALNALYPLHAGSMGGPLYEWLVALSGLALAVLGGVGAWAFVTKPRSRPSSDGGSGTVVRTPRQRTATR